MKRVLWLYPAGWRERYGEEMGSILDERAMGPFEVVDLFLGALDAHLHLRVLGSSSENRKGITMSLRTAGLAAIVGGASWGLTWLAIILNLGGQDDAAVPLFAPMFVAALAMLVALVGLSAFQARTHQTLVWASFIIPGLGALLLALGLALMALDVGNAWNAMIAGLVALPVGAIMFGAVAYRTGALARRSSALLVVGAILQVVGILTAMLADWASPLQFLTAVGAAGFAAGWIVLGVDVVRHDRLPAPGSPKPV